MEENKVEAKEQNGSKTKKVLSIVLNVVFYIFILFLFLFAIANLNKKKNDDIPTIFGRGYLNVLSGSMDGDNKDSFKKGDAIIVKILKDDDYKDLEIGDIITFVDITIDGNLDSHRIVDIRDDGYFICQGDYVQKTSPGDVYVAGSDSNTGNKTQIVRPSDVKAKYVAKISNGGNFLKFLQSFEGFGLCIVLPALILLGFEVAVLIKNIMKMNKEKMAVEMAGKEEQAKLDLEAEKERMRAELLAELKREQEKANEAEEKTSEEKTSEEVIEEKKQSEENAEAVEETK